MGAIDDDSGNWWNCGKAVKPDVKISVSLLSLK
jgi:hypothetical protein